MWRRPSILIAAVVVLLILAIVVALRWGPMTGHASTTASPSPSGALAAPLPSLVATAVYGQPDFTAHGLSSARSDTLKNPSALTADQHGGVFVTDYGNSRTLHFPATPSNGAQADQIYGQPDGQSSQPHSGATGLNYPHGVAIDPVGGLYISDMFNNRVLHYSSGSVAADRVYGQANFQDNGVNSGGLSERSLSAPQGIAVDATGIYVADSGNNRVLHYQPGATSADFVYGQGEWGSDVASLLTGESGAGATHLHTPRDVAVDGLGLYVADAGNHRVVHFRKGNAVADRVYGQRDFAPTAVTTNQGAKNPTERTLNNPTGVAVDAAGGLYVADRGNNRVLYYPLATQTLADEAATRVFGQAGFTTRAAGASAQAFNGPGALSIDSAGRLFVLDIFNQRALEFGPAA
jgi:sugar lactone lactonase YvrE